MEETSMNRKRTQRSGVCVLTGMAVGFRAFFAVVIDGRGLYGSAWLALLGAMLSALPVSAALMSFRRMSGEVQPAETLSVLCGKGGRFVIAAGLYAALTYDAAAVLRLMTGTARYVAMPESDAVMTAAVTAAAVVAAVMMGAEAAANAAMLWRKTAAALIGLLMIVQIPYLRTAWLTPVLGSGVMALAENALPAAGMFALSAGGWLLMNPNEDTGGTALLRICLKSGLAVSALAAFCGMLVPGMLTEKAVRSFRLGRLLANGRAGLSLELPYVILIYSGMLTVLLFELAAAAQALRTAVPKIGWKWAVGLTGACAFLVTVCGGAERETVVCLSGYYYILIAGPVFFFAGLNLIRRLIRQRME